MNNTAQAAAGKTRLILVLDEPSEGLTPSKRSLREFLAAYRPLTGAVNGAVIDLDSAYAAMVDACVVPGLESAGGSLRLSADLNAAAWALLANWPSVVIVDAAGATLIQAGNHHKISA